MKSYIFFIIFIFFSKIFLLQANEIQENGIEFQAHVFEDTTGYYWPKTNNNNAFIYIDDILYHKILESKDKIEDQASDYLGYFLDKDSEKVYLYGQIDETSETEDFDFDDDDEMYDHEYDESDI